MRVWMKKSANLRFSRIISVLMTLTLVLAYAGCGGGDDLIPRDLKDFVSAHLKTERRNVDLTQPFRTTIILRVRPMPIEDARDTERTLIETCVEYFKRDNIRNFINDTLVFNLRLVNDPDINLKYWTVAGDMRQVLDGKMTVDELIERADRVENWSADI